MPIVSKVGVASNSDHMHPFIVQILGTTLQHKMRVLNFHAPIVISEDVVLVIVLSYRMSILYCDLVLLVRVDHTDL